MSQDSALKRAHEMRAVAYTSFVDAIKGLKDATRLIDERIQRDGPNANYSMDSDLLSWSQIVWKLSNRLHSLDQIIETLRLEEKKE